MTHTTEDIAPAPPASVNRVPLAESHKFKAVFTDYLNRHPGLESVAFPAPTLASLDELAGKRAFSSEARATLVSVLKEQYTAIGVEAAQLKALQKLAQDDCLTITTGHQLCMYLGPLYTVLKAATIIKLAHELEEAYPHRKVVPVFWLASEDHDLGEISSVTIEGNTYRWPIAGSGAAGPQSLTGLKDSLSAIWPLLPDYLETYTQLPTLGQAQAWLLHTLFGDAGLLVLDPNHLALKQAFVPRIIRELEEGFVHPAWEAATKRMEAAGFKGQIFARETNLFLLGVGARERLVKDAQTWSAGSLGTFSQEELLALAHQSPDRFSPNVTLRPVYQEVILPNIAYIGGPAEVAYWLQLHDVFEAAGVQKPAVWPRAHTVVLTQKQAKKLQKLGLAPTDLFLPLAEAKHKVIENQNIAPPETAQLHALLEAYLQELEQMTLGQDTGLTQAVEAEKVRFRRAAQPGQRRIRKAYERRFATLTQQVEAMFQALHPNGGLQERTECYLTFALQDPDFIAKLLKEVRPTDFSFTIITL